jgi:transposase
VVSIERVIKMKNEMKFSEIQAAEISEIKMRTKSLKLYKKLEVLDYAAKGYTNKEIGRLSGYSISRVSDFVSEYMKNGIRYFMEEHRKGGNRRNLTAEEEKKIIDVFAEKAKKGQVINLEAVKAEYEKVRGVKTANSTFYAFLHRVKWRRIMPRCQHPKKASDEVIETSKKLTLR